MSGAVALASGHSFAERGFDLLERIDYRRADNEQEREAIYRLRYDAYLREGAISPNSLKELSDRYDEMPNAWTFGIYIDQKLASSIRVCVGSPTYPLTPASNVFSDVLLPEIGSGKTVIDPNRFVTDPAMTHAFPELPYLTVRLGFVACEYFKADIGAATPRLEHEAFYKRLFRMSVTAPARTFPTLTRAHSLMSVHYPSVRERILWRYPFFRSTFFERRMLFERNLVPLAPANDHRPVAQAPAMAVLGMMS
ncbi:MAG: N-acyl amino acid synthase FeeM domain-containing protein [Rhodoplanes sp.]